MSDKMDEETKKQRNNERLARKYEQEQEKELCDSYRNMGKEISLEMERSVNFNNMLEHFIARGPKR